MVESDPLNQLLLAFASGQRYADFVGQSTAAVLGMPLVTIKIKKS